ncbi:DUF58 domain-containing protein [Puia dinghuensis]|uniref:DUF58 domain-containing protein n=1 Tax=Puia dinghuensis TaxID=1792502 RepID=A0A8J2XR72_9BACT|nr:DUF58 domain-containing protein [Puia dinghuensis]GGA87958.1 hypothetical protein GCM10011511_08860 [Puia dinghuensis]
MLKRFYISLYFSRRFYWLFVGIILVFVVSYGVPFLFTVGQLLLLFFAVVTVLDYFVLFLRKAPVPVRRDVGDRMSNGDNNTVALQVKNDYPFPIRLRIIDELPDQFQLRDFSLYADLKAGEVRALDYQLRPKERGEYVFYNINVFIKSPFGLLIRRSIIEAKTMVRVLPSYLALRQYALLAASHNLAESGIKRIRKLGHSLEFEQIKEYVTGDDIRSLNWKATARKGGQLMVNTFTDEKSQQVYCLIDKGRVMKMPFDGMSLLDYAINAALVLSHVALIRQDKAGLLTFGDQIGTFLPADRKSMQMSSILEILYNQQTRWQETDYEKVYAMVRTRITQRSLIVLFTNFESLSGLERQMPYIRAIARRHLLLIVFFENTGLQQIREQEATDIEGVYVKTIADKFAYEKRLIVKELNQHGIATILTAPEHLTIQTVNKYLEIKARLAI